ncbi:hypothetical protein A0H81_03455 [Grifola frondosa]|uniref:Uncharacterized protein n=1 Tax=Grifola frondosa TaxID=5627 RepID=A0A1C7MHI0_GRIFR|nr:hypothetical protein A0H81_03455 [Grifola frondosa]
MATSSPPHRPHTRLSFTIIKLFHSSKRHHPTSRAFQRRPRTCGYTESGIDFWTTASIPQAGVLYEFVGVEMLVQWKWEKWDQNLEPEVPSSDHYANISIIWCPLKMSKYLNRALEIPYRTRSIASLARVCQHDEDAPSRYPLSLPQPAYPLLPTTVVLLAARILRFQHVSVPGWLLVLAIIVINPLLFAARVSLRRWHTRRAAERMGAALPDALAGRWIGGLDMKERFQAGIAVDFQDLITRFTFDTATEFLFGSCVNSLDAPLPYPHDCLSHEPTIQPANAAEKFSDAVAAVQIVVADRLRAGWMWPLREIFKDKTEDDRAIVDAVLEPIVKEALRKKEKMKLGEDANNEKDEENETLLDSRGWCLDPVILRDETLNILLAGRDTTASALTFAIYLLCEHPAVFKRLREEMLQYVGPRQRPTYDDIRKMRYLRAFLNESLRLYPPVRFDIRYIINETLPPNPGPTGKPIYLPAKTKCTATQSTGDPTRDIAEEFAPDQFLDSRIAKYFLQNPFIFLPFNSGPRICLGQQFAYNEMSFFVVRLLQSFATMALDLAAQPPDSLPPPKWKNAAGRKAAEKVFVKAHITVYAHGGLWVKMGEADAEA